MTFAAYFFYFSLRQFLFLNYKILTNSFKYLFVQIITVPRFRKPIMDPQGNTFQFVDSVKGKQQLHINSHIFSKISSHASVNYWRYI